MGANHVTNTFVVGIPLENTNNLEINSVCLWWVCVSPLLLFSHTATHKTSSIYRHTSPVKIFKYIVIKKIYGDIIIGGYHPIPIVAGRGGGVHYGIRPNCVCGRVLSDYCWIQFWDILTKFSWPHIQYWPTDLWK